VVILDIPELAQILDNLSDLQACVAALGQLVTEPQLDQEWYSLRQAARLKRGVEHRQGKDGNVREQESFLSTLRARPALQPAGGKPEGHVGGVAVWHRKTILEWLLQRDEDLMPQRTGKEAKAS
jgi:hypothetical protein